MKTSKYGTSYVSDFLKRDDPKATSFEHAFIEITTRSGKGPFLKKTPGLYLYKSLAFSLPKQFYSPKYSTDAVVDMTDLRSTVLATKF